LSKEHKYSYRIQPLKRKDKLSKFFDLPIDKLQSASRERRLPRSARNDKEEVLAMTKKMRLSLIGSDTAHFMPFRTLLWGRPS
jgi:hypothetical protein